MLSEEQRKLLIEAYDNGLTSTGKGHANEISKLVASIGLSEETIKNFIGYHRSTVGGSKQPRKHKSYVKGCSGYNLFCKTLGPQESMKEWGTKWSALPDEEKFKFQAEAKLVNSQTTVVNLSDRQQKASIKDCMSLIFKQIENLERLGVQAVCVSVDSTNGSIKCACTKIGDEYLRQSSLLNDFSCHVRANAQSMPGLLRETMPDYSTIRKQVQDLLNKKYSEAVGKSCQMPYSAVGVGSILVHGIPAECMPLKAPGTYGIFKLKAILAAASSIHVELMDGATTSVVPLPSSIILDAVVPMPTQPHQHSTDNNSTNNLLSLDQSNLSSVVPLSTTAIDLDTVIPLPSQLSHNSTYSPNNHFSFDRCNSSSAVATTSVVPLPSTAIDLNTVVSFPSQLSHNSTCDENNDISLDQSAIDNTILTSLLAPSSLSNVLPDTVHLSSRAIDHTPPAKISVEVASGEDTTPCCVCCRQHNQPPFQDWFVCLPCGGWHHKSCGAGKSKKTAICYNCHLTSTAKKNKKIRK